MALPLLAAMTPTQCLIAHKAYDADLLRNWLVEWKIEPVHPGQAARNVALLLNRKAYRRRNVIERMFGSVEGCNRMATRYYRLATNYSAAIALIAMVNQWLV